MQVKQDVVDAPDAKELVVSGGEIKFENVDFWYDAARPILRNLSFTIPAGENWAVVGASGCGKSTLVRLILRFYDVQGGRILIDGQVSIVWQGKRRVRRTRGRRRRRGELGVCISGSALLLSVPPCWFCCVCM